jgi:hypothetical protein
VRSLSALFLVISESILFSDNWFEASIAEIEILKYAADLTNNRQAMHGEPHFMLHCKKTT